MLTLYDLSLNINGHNFFRHLSVTCFGGCILKINGANGSGKTSLLRMIAGIQSYSGSIYFKRVNIQNIAKPYCVYIGHNLGIRTDLTVLQNLLFWSQIYHSDLLINSAIKYWNLESLLDMPCSDLSKGNLKKVALARLLSCNSDVWLLDEVDNNLDFNNLTLLNNLLYAKINSGGIVILTSHNHTKLKYMNILELSSFIK